MNAIGPDAGLPMSNLPILVSFTTSAAEMAHHRIALFTPFFEIFDDGQILVFNEQHAHKDNIGLVNIVFEFVQDSGVFGVFCGRVNLQTD